MDHPTPLCLHCEAAPQATALRLCVGCAARRGVRNLYKPRAGSSPEWDAHLQKLVERAKKRLPLFPEGETAALPPRPRPVNERNVNRNVRVHLPCQSHPGEM